MSRESYGKLAKVLLVDQITKDLSDADQVFVTSFSNLSVNSLASLRKSLREQQAGYRIVKNTIAKQVLQNKDQKDLAELVDGQCGLSVSRGDVSSISKTLVKFSADNETFQVKGVLFDGKVYDASQVKTFAELPSRDELLAKVCGGIKSPLNGLVGVLSGLTRNLVNVLDQIKNQKEA